MTRLHRLAMLLLCLMILATVLQPSTSQAGLQRQPDTPIEPANLDAPPLRSTFYDGTSTTAMTYAALPEFNVPGAMTIESWVRRTDAARCETIAARTFALSYWFGFCGGAGNNNRLRFYRGGGSFVDASATIPAARWTHVAVTFTPDAPPSTTGTVRFYVDGEAAGVASLAYTPNSDNTRPLMLGRDPSGFFFSGQLDEVRLWSVARTIDQIRDGMFREVRTAESLVAAFGNGGDREELRSLNALSRGQPRVNGILPRELTIPLAAAAMNLDGRLELATEYAGAEQLVLRYPRNAGQPDVPIYLVRSGDDLYVGVSRFATPAAAWTSAAVSLQVDPDRSGGTVATTNDFQLRLPIRSEPQYRVGNGLGGFTIVANPGGWDVAASFINDEFSAPNVEFRVNAARLGPFADGDGLAVAVSGLPLGSPSANTHVAPPGASFSVPDQWATTRYSNTGVTLPQATISGRLRNVALGNSNNSTLPTTVRLYDNARNTLITQREVAFSDFFFTVPVPPNTPLRLEYSPCPACRPTTPVVSGSFIQPTEIRDTEVIFPGCASGSCRYATTTFNLWEPIPAIALGSYTTPVVAPVELRVAPQLLTASQNVRISGTGLHPWVEIWAVTTSCSGTNPVSSNCPRVQANVVGRDPAGAWVDVTLPLMPPELRTVASWRIRDGWNRSSRGAEWRSLSPNFGVSPPPYPTIHGLGFQNVRDGTSFDEYTAVFGWNTYACAGIRPNPETCLGVRAPDPLYLLYFPVYLLYVGEGAGSGSCVGMASTSTLFNAGVLNPTSFDPNVRHPAGFTQSWFDAGQRPARWRLGPFGTLTEPAVPNNLWAEVRKNHGTQASAEFFQAMLDDVSGGRALSIDGDPVARLNELRSQLTAGTRPVVCVAPSLGSGHCVTPYAIEDVDATISRIRVYDNNWLGSTERFIEVNRTTNEFTFELGRDRVWRGTYLVTFPQQIWRNPRTAPGLAEALRFLWVGTFGTADASYRTPEGEWGWRSDGTFVDNMPGAVAGIPFFSPEADRNTRQIPLLLPIDGPAPTTQLNARGGGGYTFHAAQGGQSAQLEVAAAAAGTTDSLQVTKTAAGELAGFRFTPTQPTQGAVPRLAMTPTEGQRLLFEWTGLQMAGGTFGFEALPEQRSAVYTNGGTTLTSHTLTMLTVDEAAGQLSNRVFGPFEVPAGLYSG